ncbi:MAG TPA: hypothetical protein VNC61_10715 [Acidimicrobiales bacterium]|nr:hypothetical protein [Acidimicrobiales bacterium]
MSFPLRSFPRLAAIATALLLMGGTVVALFPADRAPGAAAGHRLRHLTLTSGSSVPAYYDVASDGGVFAFGGLPFWGSMGGHFLAKPMVGIAPTTTAGTADGRGYWTVASDGGVFAFGSAPFHGSMGGRPLNKPMVGIAADPATGGYWTVASDGGVFSFDAPFYGSLGAIRLDKPVIAMAATPDGGGYWMFASDGGVFAFGDAGYYGSTGGELLAQPVVGASATPDGRGYWLVAADGGIFTFGDAPFDGSLGGHALMHPVVSMTAADSAGYWLTDSNGAVTAFGDAGYFGSTPQHLFAPIVGMADGPGTGNAANEAYPSGSYGYDISRFQDNPPTCNQTLPSGHIVGIVQATGSSGGFPNPCLAHEAAWAGAGLNLYAYMTNGTSATAEPGCNGDQSCNFGYQAALFAFHYAQSQGVNPLVAWWLDVESNQASWTSNLSENAQVIQGALNGLRDQGINTVGIYTSPDTWNGIVGNFQPAVPLWVAWYTGDGPGNCQNIHSYAAGRGDRLPTGPVFVTQYTSTAGPNGGSLDGDYAC